MPLLSDIGARVRSSFDSLSQSLAMSINNSKTLFVPDELKPILRIDLKEQKRQREVIYARDFHEGVQGARFETDRIRDSLGLDYDEAHEFSLNFCAAIVSAVVERIKVDGWKCAKENVNLSEDERVKQEGWIARLWRATRFKAKQADVIEGAVRDGEFFVLADYDNGDAEVRFHPHKRYTDPAVMAGRTNGDGEGVRMFYRNGDTNQKPIYAVKRWVEIADNGKQEHRLTVFHPDRADFWRRAPLGWELERTEPWTNADGSPLGIPVVCFYTPGRKPEAKRAWMTQRIVNRIVHDLLQIIEVSAFRVWLFFGWSPKDKDGKPLIIGPNRWIGSEKAKPTDASAQAVEASDPAPVGELLDSFIVKMAQLTDTPTSRLLTTRAIAGEGTLKQQNEPLAKKVERRMENFEQSLEDLMKIARRIETRFGIETLDVQVLIDPVWAPIESRNADEELKEAQVEKAKVETQILKSQIDVSHAQSQRELNYTPEDIEKMKGEKAEERKASGQGMAALFNGGGI